MKMKEQLALNFKIKQLFFVCLLLLSCSCAGQTNSAIDSSYTLLDTISIKAKFFTTDKLSQIYAVTEQNEVIKYDSNGGELFRFNNNTLGNLKHIDATDPFNVLLYYPNYMTAIILDRTLNKTIEYNFANLNLIEIKAIGVSNDNNVWLYDELSFKLKKIDRRGQVLMESDDLNMVLFYALRPNFILERDNFVYVNNPETGILVFDNFAKYIRTLDFKGLDEFQVVNKQLIFRKNEKLMSFHLQPLILQNIELPAGISKEDKIRIQKNKLFVNKQDRLLIYVF